MNFITFKKFFILFGFLLMLMGCAKKSSDDFDLSNLKMQIKNDKEVIKAKPKEITKKDIINNLIPLKDRKKILGNTKYGRNDPFAPLNQTSTKEVKDLILKGFFTIENINFAYVKYIDQEGVIKLDSIGGLNTKLLPTNAYVKEINPKKEELILKIDDSFYNLKLNKSNNKPPLNINFQP